VKYFQVKDFTCDMLPDNHFDYMFSYGCPCHVSFAGISEYAKNLHAKLKKNSNCFWMVADYDQYNRAISNLNDVNIYRALIPTSRRSRPLKWFFVYLMKRSNARMRPIPADENDEPKPGRWYHSGTQRTCAMLEEAGYRIADPDVGTCLRDPVIHFIKT